MLSIIIPTKNRINQLYKTLSTYKLSNICDYEIIISDNSDSEINSNERLLFNSLNLPIKYFHDNSNKTILENFSFGLINSCGSHVIFIGDDDIVCDSIFNAFQYIKDNRIDCVISDYDLYFWPECIFNGRSYYKPGSLFLSKRGINKDINPQVELNASRKNGFLTIGDMPKAYHGIVIRSVFDKNFEKFNKHIIGGSLDMSIAIYLSINNVKTIKWHCPITIAGASPGSGGGMSTSKTHRMPISDVNFLDKDFINNWPNEVPGYWSEFTVMTASAIYVLNKYQVNATCNISALYCRILLSEHMEFDKLLRVIGNLQVEKLIEVILKFPFSMFRKILGSIAREGRILKSKFINPNNILYGVKPDQVVEISKKYAS